MTTFTMKIEDVRAESRYALVKIEEYREARWRKLIQMKIDARESLRKWLPWLKPWKEEDAVASLHEGWMFRDSPYWHEERLAKQLLTVQAPEIQISVEDWTMLSRSKVMAPPEPVIEEAGRSVGSTESRQAAENLEF